jgi:hypothetical protein
MAAVTMAEVEALMMHNLQRVGGNVGGNGIVAGKQLKVNEEYLIANNSPNRIPPTSQNPSA